MAETNSISALLIIIITVLSLPVGVFLIAGCGADLLISICLTLLGFLPGHIHAFYLEYVYFGRQNKIRLGNMAQKNAPGVYSENIQSGGRTASRTVAY